MTRMRVLGSTFLSIGFVFLFGVSFALADETADADASAGVICTAEAKMCPDGSAVGRTGPHCEFAKCPGAATAKPPTGARTGGDHVEGDVPPPPMPPARGSEGSTTNRPLQKPTPEMLKKIQASTTASNMMEMREKEMRMRMASTTKPGMATGTRPAVFPGQMKGNGGPLDELREKRQEMWQKIASSTRERIKAKVADEVSHVAARLDVAYGRLLKIADRIDSRIAKLEADGKDVGEAKSHVITARAALAAAQSSIGNIKTTFATVIASDDPEGEFSKVRDLVESIKGNLKTAQSELEAAVRLLKTFEPKKKAPTATTTRESNEGEHAGE